MWSLQPFAPQRATPGPLASSGPDMRPCRTALPRWPWLSLAALAGLTIHASGCGGDDAAATDADADAGTGPGADAAGPGDDPRLYPLEVGRRWSYVVTSTYLSCPADPGREVHVTGTVVIDGRTTYESTGLCGQVGHTSVDGDVVEDYYDWGPTGWSRLLDEPVADGHSWTTGNGSATYGMRYEQAGAVDGYPDCWRVVQEVAYTSRWTYCRGVGLVRFELVDLAGGTINASLIDRSW